MLISVPRKLCLLVASFCAALSIYCTRFEMHRLLGKLTFSGCNPTPWMLVETAGVGAMLSTSRSDRIRSFGGVVALEQVRIELSNKRERISRKERVGVVETFVLKYMPLNQGKFPSASTVIRETGGSWQTVKEILNELQARLKEEAAITDELSQNLKSDEKVLGFSVEEGIKTLNQSNFDFDTNHLAFSHHQETVRTSDGDFNAVPITRLKDACSVKSSEQSISSEKADLEDQVANLCNVNKQSLRKYVHAQNTSGPQGSFPHFSLESHSKGSAREKVHPEGTSNKSSLFEDKMSKKSTPEDRDSAMEKMSDASIGKNTLWERLHAVTTSRNQIGAELFSEAYTKRSAGSNTCTSSKGGEEEDDSDFTSLDYPQPDGLKSFSHKLKDSSVLGKEAVVPANLQPLSYEICVRYLRSDATETDLREAFRDCGGIIRAQPLRSAKNPDAQLTYGFVRFDTEEGFRKALRKEPVIRGTKVAVFPSTSIKGSLSNRISSGCNIKKPTGLDDHVQATPGVNDLKNVSQYEGYPVIVENVPSSILSKVKEVLGTHGEILSSYYKADESGDATALINFKSEEAKENALATHWVYLGGKPFRVSRLDSPKTTVVRVSNISHETDEDRVVNACKSCGYFQKIELRASGVVDVYFHPKESGNMIRILDRLNEVHMDRRRWQAQPAPRLSAQAATELFSSADGQKWIKFQQCQVAEKLETTISKAVVHMEDLKYLIYLKWHGKPYK